MLSDKFYKKGNKLLRLLNIKTREVKNNNDIIKAKNFSAILKYKGVYKNEWINKHYQWGIRRENK